MIYYRRIIGYCCSGFDVIFYYCKENKTYKIVKMLCFTGKYNQSLYYNYN